MKGIYIFGTLFAKGWIPYQKLTELVNPFKFKFNT
jgi:hypothetical protein